MRRMKSIQQQDELLRELKERRRKILFEQEQTAEPEGGPIAEAIGTQLWEVEEEINKLEKP